MQEKLYQCVVTIESQSLTVPFIFLGNFQPFTLFLSTFLLIPLLPSVFLASVLPPQGKGYSVLLFEVDICIIRLGCVIVSGLPHQRVLQRREGAVQSNNG